MRGLITNIFSAGKVYVCFCGWLLQPVCANTMAANWVFYQLCHLSLPIPVLSLAIPGLSLAIPGLSLLVPILSQDVPGMSYPSPVKSDLSLVHVFILSSECQKFITCL